jgi:hypothetical protein
MNAQPASGKPPTQQARNIQPPIAEFSEKTRTEFFNLLGRFA